VVDRPQSAESSAEFLSIMNRVSTLLRSRSVQAALFTAIVTATTFGQTVTFYGIGQLPGGAMSSQIRDVTVTSTGILAAGSAQQNPTGQIVDTAVIWTPTTGLQTLASLNNVSIPIGGRFITASAISAGNNLIAGRISTDTTGRHLLPALYNPGGPLTAILGIPEGYIWGGANGISSDGKIVYGFTQDPSGNMQGFEWTLATGAVQLPAIPGCVSIVPTSRSCSSDGTNAVGLATTADGAVDGPGCVAWEFNTTTGMSVLPLAPGGTWAGASGIDPSGTYIVGCGDTPANPNGEVFLWTGGALTTLGVPAAEAATGIADNFAGVTRNGDVVVIAGLLGSYVNNSYGWSDLQTALVAGGGNLTGWSVLTAFGINGDGTLVFGSGTHNGGLEGFVAQVPTGYFKKVGKPAKTK
jgi:hypothetical protein